MNVRLPSLPVITSKVAGFTMIELLIVITILGILAVAVLSAINPIEQINRGRDTGKRSDAEQLLSAIDRYNAFNGFQPWMTNASDSTLGISDDSGYPVIFNDTMEVNDISGCQVLHRLGTTGPATELTGCSPSNELKDSFITRVTSGNERMLYIYNRGNNGDSTYVCFPPQSLAFADEASRRCNGPEGEGLPDDISPEAAAFICNPDVHSLGFDTPLSCLP